RLETVTGLKCTGDWRLMFVRVLKSSKTNWLLTCREFLSVFESQQSVCLCVCLGVCVCECVCVCVCACDRETCIVFDHAYVCGILSNSVVLHEQACGVG